MIAVFKTTVYDDTGFKFYLFSHAETEKEFTDYVEQCRELAFYDTGVIAAYGDKLLTLSKRSENPISERRAGDGKNDQNPPRPEGYQGIG